MKLPVQKRGLIYDVTNKNGVISIGGETSMSADYIVQRGNISIGFGHSYLANGGTVNYAGTISIENGAVTNWSNMSGHYEPRSRNKSHKGTLYVTIWHPFK